MTTPVFWLHGVALLVQLAAVFFVLNMLRHIRAYRLAVAALALALVMMAYRRLLPLLEAPLRAGYHAMLDAWLALAISLLIGLGLAGMRRAWSELDRLRRDAEQRSRTDYLTGTNNRPEIEARIVQEISRSRRMGEPLCLALLDIDHFKRVNDAHGHEIGDTVLKNLVAFCNEHLRAQDVLGRYGGEEFLILMPGTSAEAARGACERLRTALVQHPCAQGADGQPVTITVSVGVTVIAPRLTEPPYLLMKTAINQADSAMYLAKRRGRNRTQVFQG